MKNVREYILIPVRLWLHASLILSAVVSALSIYLAKEGVWSIVIFSLPATLIASLPALAVMLIGFFFITRSAGSTNKCINQLTLLCMLIALLYGSLAGLIVAKADDEQNWPAVILCCIVLLEASVVAAIVFNQSLIRRHFNNRFSPNSFIPSKPNKYMEPITSETSVNESSNKVLIKGLITGILILVMLIPTWFVTTLVEERVQRQKEIVQEVSNKWAAAQRISGPYITVPYTEYYIAGDGKKQAAVKYLVLLPETLSVNSKVSPEKTHRSIYNVLLYRTAVTANGTFNIKLPDDVIPENIDFTKAKLCVGVSDYKGIEEKVIVLFNNKAYSLTPGLPTHEIDDIGLSAPVALSSADIAKPLTFNTSLKLKGSRELRFLPLSANSTYLLSSSWPDPSFDGNTLPLERKVSDSGFVARWNFNEANLPFGTVIREGTFKNTSIAFGVNMVQPADHYAKTIRSIKYAILFIGLTFALFFIVELMQHKPVHPVQYILIGLALVIFYTLLLSISEFVQFDIAYLIGATATVMLIAVYAKWHFQSWMSAGVFAAVLGSLYGFIFILIQLEDTALLVGSIGLFIVLALAMYASRKVNWYGYQAKASL